MRHFIFFIFGLIFGSFANVLIYRPIAGLKLNEPRFSICPICRNKINWYDNIPLFSYIILKGRCRYCGSKISLRYPIVELSFAVVFLLNSFLFPLDKVIAMNLIFLVSVPAFMIDLKMMLLPDYTWILVSFTALYVNLRYYREFLILDILGTVITILILLLLRTRYKEGIGEGDILLLPAFTFGCGIFYMPVLLFLSSLGGIVFSLMNKKRIIPFGPFIIFFGYLLLMLRYLNINIFML
ncbi:MAG: prepilin peptidase [Fervidobacterium sp.]